MNAKKPEGGKTVSRKAHENLAKHAEQEAAKATTREKREGLTDLAKQHRDLIKKGKID